MNWGKAIIGAFVLFAAIMMYFLLSAVFSKSEAVPDKYYEKGNAFQNEIDEEKGAELFKPHLEYYNPKGCFALTFKGSLPDSGIAFFQWPADEKYNFSKKFVVPQSGSEKLFECNNPKGGWNARIEFWQAGKKYIYKQKVWVE